MKKFLLPFIILSVFILDFCTTAKNAAGKKMIVQSVSYTADVAPILKERCTPCHFPEGGKRQFLDTYQAAKTYIDSILYRTQLPTDHPKVMPFKQKKEPLSDSLINVIKMWKEQDFPS